MANTFVDLVKEYLPKHEYNIYSRIDLSDPHNFRKVEDGVSPHVMEELDYIGKVKRDFAPTDETGETHLVRAVVKYPVATDMLRRSLTIRLRCDDDDILVMKVMDGKEMSMTDREARRQRSEEYVDAVRSLHDGEDFVSRSGGVKTVSKFDSAGKVMRIYRTDDEEYHAVATVEPVDEQTVEVVLEPIMKPIPDDKVVFYGDIPKGDVKKLVRYPDGRIRFHTSKTIVRESAGDGGEKARKWVVPITYVDTGEDENFEICVIDSVDDEEVIKELALSIKIAETGRTASDFEVHPPRKEGMCE